METIKVIDLLNKIANGEEVPKIIYDNKMYVFNKKCKWFEDFSNDDIMTVFRFQELNDEIEVVKTIEDTPKEDKKIEKLNMNKLGTITDIKNKINEIIDKVNGE